MIFADLHIHSKYSRATSKDMDVKHLSRFGEMKGLNVIGSGDITHPKWREELRNETEPLGNGVFKSKYNNTLFVLSSEIATIYSQDDKLRRVHHVVLFPDFDVVEQFYDELKIDLYKRGKKCNFSSDGRPIIGMGSVELCEHLFSVSKKNILIPAHIWTPWFSVFGSKSGFDNLNDCYGEFAKDLFALETGLSSDPLMNWRLSSISDKVLVSNSDCHSPFVSRIGRECNVLRGDASDFSYDYLLNALKRKELEFTVEVDPSYGKYHFDGHRNCNVCLNPSESIKIGNKCPVCGRELTIGVLHRVEELADKPEGYKPAKAVPFEYHIPLIEIVSNLVSSGVSTKKVWVIYEALIKKYGNEFNIMFKVSVDDLNNSFANLGSIVKSLRDKSLRVKPGYDGVYGEPVINANVNPQKSIGDF
ncbi:DNA helicase UvrD [archaeon CG07_land_8_20_14_0_80_38_8]|nr:MAG: DNA helicase UvrD [archaeon CG07_land_8_20_14_0_80_38_8]PIU89568.1 MAG: DNA helicase UvrD [archaeon CG06_land_8_20_14_3_00_37_11]